MSIESPEKQKMNTKNLIIGGKTIGQGHPTFVIAEIGINHNGMVSVAKKLIDSAKKAGADAVKFQKRTVPIVFGEQELAQARPVHREVLKSAIDRGVLSADAVSRLKSSDFEKSTNGDLKYALEFTQDEYREIADYCNQIGIIWFASPWDEESVDFLDDLGTPAYKIASASITDDNLLKHIRSKERPIIMSTGGANLDMIKYAVSVIGKNDLALLHCTSFYVKPVDGSERMCEMVNLKAIGTLKKEFPELPIGFSSHFSGIMPALYSVVLGADIVEAHITLERSMWGSDQASSLEPHEFSELVRKIREYEVLRGDGEVVIYPEEVPVMKKLRRKTSDGQTELFLKHLANHVRHK